ncbi:MAG: hypothetical protein AAGJ52_14185, partial [Pseudomonadota bacterium]
NLEWQPVTDQQLEVGDLIRIDLAVQLPAPRFHLAVTDHLPGGFRPIDPALTGVLPANALRDEQLNFFEERKLGQPKSRFYAQSLGRGTHSISHYAEVTHAGDFAWLPADLELMYDETQFARTSASRILITQ